MSTSPFIKPLLLFTASFALALTSSIISTAKAFDISPQFQDYAKYTTIITNNGDEADVYYPNPADLSSSSYDFPVVLLLQGALVDKQFYSNYASQVAKYGFIVVVPNHFRLFQGQPVPLPETSQVKAVLDQIKLEDQSTTSPIAGIVDTQKFGLLGHSFGAAVGLSVIANQCIIFLCSAPFDRPSELLAGAFFGANLRNPITNEFIPIQNDGIAIALLQGELDGVALPERAVQTFEQIKTPPKVFVSIAGTNHFGITNGNNPAGAQPDPIAPTLEQAVAIETIARWSALFLRSSLLNDPDARDYIFSVGDQLDPNVTVTAVDVSESSLVVGLVAFGTLGVVARWKKQRLNF